MSVPTPHIGASAGEIARTVLMPGDPLRAKWIAETYLENPVCYNQVRGMYGYRDLPGQTRLRPGQRHGNGLHRHLFL